MVKDRFYFGGESMKRFLWLVLVVGACLKGEASSLRGFSNLASGYLADEQANYRLSFPAVGKVGFQKDTNTCSVDTYGRASGCTRMLFPVDVVSAKEISVHDGLALYELNAEWRLVHQKIALGGSSVYLLKLDAAGSVLKRIPLYSGLN